MKPVVVASYDDGYILNGDSCDVDVQRFVSQELGIEFDAVVTDPPYGLILDESWDKKNTATAEQFAQWMLSWTNVWLPTLKKNGAMYVWGGIGRPQFRPFFRYIDLIESQTSLRMSNLITWSKKRAIGTAANFLFTREECAFFINGDVKKPATFNIPLLEEKRPYAGFNKKYPAKSEFYRRTNVWTDVIEIFRDKLHVAQKALRVIEIPIEVSTNSGEWVLDMFAGSGTTAVACRKLGRKFVVIESDSKQCEIIKERLETDYDRRKAGRKSRKRP